MYGIDIFDNIGMPLDWATVYYGINRGILNIDIAHEFACRQLECNEHVSEEEIALSWHIKNRQDVLEQIEPMLSTCGNVEKSLEKAKDKIRIAIIINLRKTEKDIDRLLEQIEIVYADFGYPVDMEEFISYMPSSEGYDPSKHKFEDNKCHLLTNLDDFIREKKQEYGLKEK